MPIQKASFPADLTIVRTLFEEYAASLGVELCFQGFAEELATLPGKYVPPRGGLWLASDDHEVAGCIAFRQFTEETCEMKRLYVRPAYRGSGLGRSLADHVIRAAIDSGYRRICLDTLPTMTGAIALYRSLGFAEVEPYCHNPVPGALFFARQLA